MMRSSFRRYIVRFATMLSFVAALVAGLPAMDVSGIASAQTKNATAKKKKGNSATGTQKKPTSNQKKTAGTPAGQKKGKKQSAQGKKTTQGKKGVGPKSSGGPKSSAEAKKLQEAAQRDIQQTKEQLRLNDQQIKAGLSDLNRLSSEIATGRTQVAGLQKKVAGLNSQIENLGREITKNESDLKLMRE